ncbi:MAG: hypothetical protein ACRD96_19875, partial [Bryobacteraceae bacterium]
YQVLADRVRYYSLERGEWEEIPLELVDLARTRRETRARQEAVEEETKQLAEEDKADRERRREIEKIPHGPGVHLVAGDQIRTLKSAESKVQTNKRRSVLKVLSPIPIVAGKGTVELDGERSAQIVESERPEFYITLSAEQRFGIVRLGAKKGVRIVERLTYVPVTKEVIEELDAVEIFRQQVADGLYKIWPKQPLPPGEYAVVEYTEGKLNIQVWDFAWRSKP